MERSGWARSNVAEIEFRILGPLEVVVDGRLLDLGGLKQRSLLAVLLLDANRPVSRDRLIDALWDEAPPATADKALQVYVSQLRKLLGKDRVITQPPGYLVRVQPEEFDLPRFRRLRSEGRSREALALWRGAALAEFAQQRFAQSERAHLEELRLTCLEERLEADLAAGRHTDVVGELETLVREHPLRERLLELHLVALYRSGRQADALAAYQDARARFVDELGIEPRRSLRELHLAILRQEATLDRTPAERSTVDASRSIFIGREDELQQLLAGLEDALVGRGRLFLLVGEPGIGKSRLADELIRHARERDVRVLVGRCWEASGAPAYWPWVQSLRGYVRECDPATLRRQLGGSAGEVAQILPELREVLADLPDPGQLDPESARFRLFDATTEFLRNASNERPVLLFLDDLHAADTPSLLLLQFLTRELASTRMLVVAACRDVDPVPGRPLVSLLAETTREPVTTRLHLTGLSPRAVAEYVALAATDLATPELAAELHEETDGNPLFVAETVRLLAVEGRIALPQTVRDVIARRLAHLDDKCNRLLVLASVLGREFDLDALAQLAGTSDEELLDTLDGATAARVISDVPGAVERMRFAHVLIRDTLYETLTTPRRVRLHRLAVEALSGLYGDEPGPHLAELAHHAVAGSDFARGASWARRAGNHALELLAYEEAARLYETALDALALADPTDDPTRCELLLALGDADARAGNSAAAKTAFVEAAAVARRLGLRAELARAAAGYGGRTVWSRSGSDERLIPLLEEGLAAVPDDDEVLRARLLGRLAGALRDEHDRSRRDAVSRAALDAARKSGDPRALIYALDGRVSAILAPDTVGECLQTAKELRETAERIGDIERAINGAMDTFLVRVLLGDVQAAKRDLESMRQRAEALRQAVQLWHVNSAQAMLAIAEGRFADAEERIARAFSIGDRAQPEMAIPVHRLQRFALHELRGTLGELDVDLEQLPTLFPRRPVFRCAVAYLRTRVGDHDDAGRILAEFAADDFASLPFDMEWLLGMSLLVETCVALGASDMAARLYELLLPWAALNVSDHPEGIRGSVGRYLGLLAGALERWDESVGHFERALGANQAMGFPPWHARTCDDFAQILRRRGRDGDHARALQLASTAEATYRELGVQGHATAAT
jgi:DNA-binding SARP family transcriptional activator